MRAARIDGTLPISASGLPLTPRAFSTSEKSPLPAPT